MFKKYKIKKRKKAINIYFIFAIFVVLSICVSSGYALFSDTLTIHGTVTVNPSGGGGGSDTPSYELGNSTYTWKLISNWGSAGNYTYQVDFVFTNLDEDASNWVIQFDVPEGISTDNTLAWFFKDVTVNGTTITASPAEHSHIYDVANGGQLTLTLQLTFETQVDFYIKNVVFNGKLATDVTEN